ncbi:unnamed protein product [Miscanthus lutarioriparius]|uniref:Uncharacterized protein n=1 Tax=Miscanthus lutarioriparius TaxID=422564 RepID=A0A811R7I1_9POAL|nr:unnamed protein product [Miscanthus lutarioriparius]
MARPRATTNAASSKPKSKPKAKPSCPGPGPSLSFRLSPSSPPAKPGTRNSTPLVSPAATSTIGDLRSLAASHLDSLKRRLDALHGDCVRDLEASHSRISKRVKMQSHGCLQLAEEVEKEQKKMADKIAEHAELVKTSYKKFVAEVQASTSRGTLQTETTYYLNFSSVPCVSLQQTCFVLTLVVATSVQVVNPYLADACLFILDQVPLSTSIEDQNISDLNHVCSSSTLAIA